MIDPNFARTMIRTDDLTPATLQGRLAGMAISRTEEDHELFDLLIEISARGITLACSRTNEERLILKPKCAVNHQMAQKVKRFKTRIIRMMQDQEYRTTGVIQCQRQVFGLAEEWAQGKGKAR